MPASKSSNPAFSEPTTLQPSLNVSLSVYPDGTETGAEAVEAQVVWSRQGGLTLQYRLSGKMDEIRVPPPQLAAFIEGLWEHTCFEAFVGIAGEEAYREYNLSPSGQWAVYGFSAYRQRDDLSRPELAPTIVVKRSDDSLELEAVLAPELLPHIPPGAVIEVGLTAVVESVDGGCTYWALAHTGEKPDFHRRDAFILNLVAPANRVGP